MAANHTGTGTHLIETLEGRCLLSGHSLTPHIHPGVRDHHHHHDHFLLFVEAGTRFEASHRPRPLFSRDFSTPSFVFSTTPLTFRHAGTIGETGGLFFNFSSDGMWSLTF